MMLPTSGLDTARTTHRDDHAALHRAHNVYTYADDYKDVPTALAAAVTNAIPHVILTPGKTYSVNATWIIPAGVTLEGNGAVLKAASALNPMLQPSDYSVVRGCVIDADGKAAVGLLIQANFVTVENNRLRNFAADATAIKAGGALYPTFTRNILSNVSGRGLDALDAYAANPEQVYYGLNHSLSVQNVWSAAGGAIRVEGLLTSIADDFELTHNGAAVVEVGGTVQSQLNMSAAYFELDKGSTPMVAIQVNTSSHANLRDVQAFGDLTDTGAEFIHCDLADALTVTGCRVSRFAVGLAGGFGNNADVMIAGNQFFNVATVSTLTNLVNAESALVVLPGTKLGI